MADRNSSRHHASAPTSSMLRDEIDKGRSADKIAGSDPAAAPLGTDDEAAGMPPTPREVSMAMRHERRASSDPAQGSRQASWWLIAAAIVAIAVVALVVLI